MGRKKKENANQADVSNKAKSGATPAEQIKKTKILRSVACVVIAVAISALSFAIGMCVSWFSIDSEMRTLIEVKKKIDKEYYQEISDEQFYGALFGAINEDLLDAYSEYLTPEEFAALTSDLNGSRAGVGVVIQSERAAGEKQMLILRVCGNSPAEAAGITAGSYIVGFGASAAEITRSEDYDAFTAFLQDYGAGEKFYIRIQENGVERTLEISKEEYVENYVFYRSNKTAYTFGTDFVCDAIASEQYLSCLDDDTAYIRLVQFTGNSVRAFMRAMSIFKQEHKKNLVLDLRGNGGGYMDAMQTISSYFCKNATQQRPVVAIADYGKKKENFRAEGNVYGEYFQTDSRICVLADENSASASECLIGCMLDYGAIDYGDICLTETNGVAKTYGKGIMQTTYLVNFVKRDALKLTTARVLWPVSKNCIHDVGVVAESGTKTVARDYTGENELINAIKTLLG